MCHIASACSHDDDYKPGIFLCWRVAILAPSDLSMQMASAEMVQCSLCAMPHDRVARKSAEDFLDKIDASMGSAVLGDTILACDACSKPTCRQHRYKIDSDSNPSDGLSRLGISDAWTLAQGWRLRELEPLTWSELSAVAGDTLGSFIDIGVFSSDIDIGESE